MRLIEDMRLCRRDHAYNVFITLHIPVRTCEGQMASVPISEESVFLQESVIRGHHIFKEVTFRRNSSSSKRNRRHSRATHGRNCPWTRTKGGFGSVLALSGTRRSISGEVTSRRKYRKSLLYLKQLKS